MTDDLRLRLQNVVALMREYTATPKGFLASVVAQKIDIWANLLDAVLRDLDARAEPTALIVRLERNLAESKMGYTERFDTQAERFYLDTGFMAPGKSLPLEMHGEDHAKRRGEAWDVWQQRQRGQWQADIREVVEHLRTVSPLPARGETP